MSQPLAGTGPTATDIHRPRYQSVQLDYVDISDDENFDEYYSVDCDPSLDPQKLSEDQTYREHVKAVRHFLGWPVPDVTPSWAFIQPPLVFCFPYSRKDISEVSHRRIRPCMKYLNGVIANG